MVVEYEKTQRIFLINSLPKSGTYLAAKFLEEIGVDNSGLHLRKNALWDFKNRSLDQIISNPDQFKANIPLPVSLARIRSGEFFLAHLEYEMCIENILTQFNAKHIFLYRKIRDILVSHCRFVCDPRRSNPPSWYVSSLNKAEMFLIYFKNIGANYLKSISLQLQWVDSNVQKIIFEDLLGDNGKNKQINSLRILVESVGVDFRSKDFCDIFKNKCLSAQTRTYSGRRSEMADFCSDQAESIFVSNGGLDMERKLDSAMTAESQRVSSTPFGKRPMS